MSNNNIRGLYVIHNVSANRIDQSVTTEKKTPVPITLVGSDPNQNATLTASIVTNPSHGMLSAINQDSGVVTYTPNQNFVGNDGFNFKVNNGKADSI